MRQRLSESRRRGFSLLEMSVAVSIAAVFISVFLTLSLRMAQAQKQQALRSEAVAHLEAFMAEKTEEGPALWQGPWQSKISSGNTTFIVEAQEVPFDFVTDKSLSRLSATVRWESPSGSQKISREVWVHARLQ